MQPPSAVPHRRSPPYQEVENVRAGGPGIYPYLHPWHKPLVMDGLRKRTTGPKALLQCIEAGASVMRSQSCFGIVEVLTKIAFILLGNGNRTWNILADQVSLDDLYLRSSGMLFPVPAMFPNARIAPVSFCISLLGVGASAMSRNVPPCTVLVLVLLGSVVRSTLDSNWQCMCLVLYGYIFSHDSTVGCIPLYAYQWKSPCVHIFCVKHPLFPPIKKAPYLKGRGDERDGPVRQSLTTVMSHASTHTYEQNRCCRS